MASSLYDDDILDGTPLNDPSMETVENDSDEDNAPLVGLRVAANWSEYDSVNMTSSNVNSSLKLMQSHMAVKRAQGRRQGQDTANGQWSSSVAPVVDLKPRAPSYGDGAVRFNHLTGRLERNTVPVGRPAPKLATPTMNSGGLMYGEPNLPLGVADEYDPLFPNDFEELAHLKRERRRLDDLSANNSNSKNISGLCRRPDFSDEEDDDTNEDGDGYTAAFGNRSRRSTTTINAGAAIAPPSSLLEDVTVAPGSQTDDAHDPTVNATSSKFGINAVAAKMMVRMGYKEGQGLGREGQGMSTALVVEKTSRHGGKIIHERDQHRQQQQKSQQQQQLQQQTALSNYLNTNPEETFNTLPLPENRSCVILLRNMCGPGEVDDDLEPETAEECAKYGKVVMCMIYELPEASDDEIIRIFVEFEEEEAATNAVLDLNGRFFAGRVVKAGFYNADKFRNLELSDPPISG